MNRYFVAPQGRTVLYRNWRGHAAGATPTEFAVVRAIALGSHNAREIMQVTGESDIAALLARLVDRNWLEEVRQPTARKSFAVTKEESR